jgi:hypothetical protein
MKAFLVARNASKARPMEAKPAMDSSAYPLGV